MYTRIDPTKCTGREAMEQAKYIAMLCNVGAISYDEAKETAQPFIDRFNDIARSIAKMHQVKFKPVTFAGIRR